MKSFISFFLGFFGFLTLLNLLRRDVITAPVSFSLCLRVFAYWRFDVGVGEAVGIHGSEVSAAYDAHY